MLSRNNCLRKFSFVLCMKSRAAIFKAESLQRIYLTFLVEIIVGNLAEVFNASHTQCDIGDLTKDSATGVPGTSLGFKGFIYIKAEY